MARLILVSGDLVLERHTYEGAKSGARDTSHLPTHRREEIGGAARTHQLLEALTMAHPTSKNPIITYLGCEPVGGGPPMLETFTFWSPHRRIGSKEQAWRMARRIGWGGASEQKRGVTLAQLPSAQLPHVLVLDDRGATFRDSENALAWFLPRKSSRGVPRWIVLAMRAPLDGGDLLHQLAGRLDLRRRLVVVVSAHDLRLAGVHLSRGLSWERTAEDLRAAITQDPTLQQLAKAQHLVVAFENDGAIWVASRRRSASAALVFDAAGAEGEWSERRSGEVPDSLCCLAAAVANRLAGSDGRQVDLGPALGQGLSAMRVLHDEGHGTAVSEKGAHYVATGFPFGRVAAALLHPPHRFSRASVPMRNGQRWTILDSLQQEGADQPLYGFARQLALRGERVLEHVPHLRVAALVTADRGEIEALRSLQWLLSAYRDTNSGKKPLSLGVFGAPGSGKSFGVQQLVVGVFGEPGTPQYDGWLEFNLSQFEHSTDLIGALHQVRDKRLQGLVPVVFWDEFDAQEYRWLRHLLAPMQDGRFQDGTATHTVGKAVFIFAGGTSHSFERFGTFDTAEARRQFALSKGPDFKSRLDGYLNVLGPNPVNEADRDYPVRRAFLVRNMLGCRAEEALDIDSGVLTALLETDVYTHGARSLGKVLEPLATARRASSGTVMRWQLPAANQLALHVPDPASFHKLCEREQAFRAEAMVEKLSPAIHETWRRLARPKARRHDVAFDDLPAVTRRANSAAARRIPDILALVGLQVVAGRGSPARAAAVQSLLERHLDLLAEEEHRGWMAHLESEGWRFGEARDDSARLHNCLRPYHELAESDKDRDREAVRHFPDYVSLVGFHIAPR